MGWILYKTAVSLARKQGRSSVLHGNEDISVNRMYFIARKGQNVKFFKILI